MLTNYEILQWQATLFEITWACPVVPMKLGDLRILTSSESKYSWEIIKNIDLISYLKFTLEIIWASLHFGRDIKMGKEYSNVYLLIFLSFISPSIKY